MSYCANHKKRLGDLLVDNSIISQEQLTEALAEQRKTKRKLGDLLISQGYISEQQLIEVLEFQLGIPHVSLFKYQIDPAITQIIREHGQTLSSASLHEGRRQADGRYG